MSTWKISPVLAAAVSTAWLMAAVPAYAAGDKADAREACKDLMGDRNMKNVDVDDVSKNKKGNVVVEADATAAAARSLTYDEAAASAAPGQPPDDAMAKSATSAKAASGATSATS